MRPFRFLISLLLCGVLAFLPPAVLAVSLIRDAEIESTLRAYGNPIFSTAGLEPEAIHIFIVDDPTVNAYVAGGQNMFIHTGLILKTDRPSMLIGVMAHETGHMAGGHLAQGTEKLKDAQLGAVLTALLGVAAAAGGAGPAGMALMTGGQEVALRNYLHFSRANESAADQAGLNYLDQLGISAAGMLRMLEILRQDENRSYGNPDPYTRTHPLSIDRITHIRNHVMQSSLKDDAGTALFADRHARMIAKLKGFTLSPEWTLRDYPAKDTSVAARYARAIAYFRTPDLAKALAELDGLIKEHPQDAYFHELRGQMLFENGRVAEAAQAYARAAELQPNAPLILTDYGKVLMSAEDKPNLAKATKILEHASILDNTNPDTWHYLALAYGKAQNLGLFYLSSAEEAALVDNTQAVIRDVSLALKYLSHDNPARLRANDLKLLAEKEKQENKDKGGEKKEKDGH